MSFDDYLRSFYDSERKRPHNKTAQSFQDPLHMNIGTPPLNKPEGIPMSKSHNGYSIPFRWSALKKVSVTYQIPT